LQKQAKLLKISKILNIQVLWIDEPVERSQPDFIADAEFEKYRCGPRRSHMKKA